MVKGRPSEHSGSGTGCPPASQRGQCFTVRNALGPSEYKKSATGMMTPQARVCLFCYCVNTVKIVIQLENKDTKPFHPETKLLPGETWSAVCRHL